MSTDTTQPVRTHNRSEAIARMNAIARRDAEGKAKPADATDLPLALMAARQTIDDYEALVAVHRQVAALESPAAGVADARRRMADAAVAVATHDEATWRMRDERLVERAALDGALKAAKREHAERASASHRLGVLRFEHREALGLGPIDLDAHQLAHADLVCSVPFDGPLLQVDAATYVREHARRRRIMAAADEAMRREFEAGPLAGWTARATASWIKEAYHNLIGDPVGDEPRYTPPTWRSLLDAGRIAEFDDPEAG